MKKAFGRSELCTAFCPDAGGAFQWYDARKKVWIWDFVGTGWWGKRSKASVLRQANVTDNIPVGTRYRFVGVERWIRAPKPKRGWWAVIRYAVEVTKDRVVMKRCRHRKVAE